jgi:hypothetical protein
MSERRLPVRPNLEQLKHQAKDLLRDIRAGDPAAVAEWTKFSSGIDPASAKLADAQHVLARMYEAPNWPRLVHACQLVHAIWEDDIATVRTLIEKNPQLLHESALIRDSNWGPPMSYAANLGRDEIIRMLHQMGAKDLEHATGRATLQGKIGTARMLHEFLGRPKPPDDCLGGPAYTLSVSGTALMLELGARVVDDNGRRLAPVDVVLETDSRKPEAKHQILEMYVKAGLGLPDTPTMAIHRGRIDLLEAHLRRDPGLLRRTFSIEEIYPPDLGCHDEVLATHGTPLGGATLLHLCADYDELAIARWLLDHGMDVDTPAAIDADGFGGHTALFATVVSQPNFWMNHNGLPQVAPFTELLLQHGANPNARASLRKRLHPGYAPKFDTERMYEYRDVTPIGWGQRFHAKVFVSKPAMKLIAERGGAA